MPLPPLTIATALDDQYGVPLSAMLRSLIHHLPAALPFNLFILSNGLTKFSLNRIDRSCIGANVTLRHLTVNPSILADLKLTDHVSLATYYRLLLESLLPDVPRLIYLDPDILVLKSIVPLWETDLHDLPLAAVPNASRHSATFGSPNGIPAYAKLGLPPDLPTFNAGVMLIDLDHWRKSQVSRQTLDYLRAYHDDVLFWDQDGLNVALHHQWKPLPAHWNVMTNHFPTLAYSPDSILSPELYAQTLASPSIVHFASRQKPWGRNYQGLFATEFNHYALRF